MRAQWIVVGRHRAADQSRLRAREADAAVADRARRRSACRSRWRRRRIVAPRRQLAVGGHADRARPAGTCRSSAQRLSLALRRRTGRLGALAVEVMTDSQGSADVHRAPRRRSGSTGNRSSVIATPVGTDADNARARVLSITVNPANATRADGGVHGHAGDAGSRPAASPSTPRRRRTKASACTSCTYHVGLRRRRRPRPAAIVTHTFPSAGRFIVTLTAMDARARRQTAQQTVIVTAPTIRRAGGHVVAEPADRRAGGDIHGDRDGRAEPSHRVVSVHLGRRRRTARVRRVDSAHVLAGAVTIPLTLTVRDDLGQSSTSQRQSSPWPAV